MAVNVNVRLGWLDGERPDDTARELKELRMMVRHLLQGQADLKELLAKLRADVAALKAEPPPPP